MPVACGGARDLYGRCRTSHLWRAQSRFPRQRWPSAPLQLKGPFNVTIAVGAGQAASAIVRCHRHNGPAALSTRSTQATLDGPPCAEARTKRPFIVSWGHPRADGQPGEGWLSMQDTLVRPRLEVGQDTTGYARYCRPPVQDRSRNQPRGSVPNALQEVCPALALSLIHI